MSKCVEVYADYGHIIKEDPLGFLTFSAFLHNLDGGVLNSLFNKNIDINSVFGKYKVNTIKYDISKYLFDKM